MKSDNQDILDMLDVLKLPVAVKTFRSLQKSPELGHYSAMQLIRELLTPQYLETLNKRFETNLRFSGVIDKGALIENLKTGNGRIYNDTILFSLRLLRGSMSTELPGTFHRLLRSPG